MYMVSYFLENMGNRFVRYKDSLRNLHLDWESPRTKFIVYTLIIGLLLGSIVTIYSRYLSKEKVGEETTGRRPENDDIIKIRILRIIEATMINYNEMLKGHTLTEYRIPAIFDPKDALDRFIVQHSLGMDDIDGYCDWNDMNSWITSLSNTNDPVFEFVRDNNRDCLKMSTYLNLDIHDGKYDIIRVSSHLAGIRLRFDHVSNDAPRYKEGMDGFVTKRGAEISSIMENRYEKELRNKWNSNREGPLDDDRLKDLKYRMSESLKLNEPLRVLNLKMIKLRRSKVREEVSDSQIQSGRIDDIHRTRNGQDFETFNPNPSTIDGSNGAIMKGSGSLSEGTRTNTDTIVPNPENQSAWERYGRKEFKDTDSLDNDSGSDLPEEPMIGNLALCLRNVSVGRSSLPSTDLSNNVFTVLITVMDNYRELMEGREMSPYLYSWKILDKDKDNSHEYVLNYDHTYDHGSKVKDRVTDDQSISIPEGAPGKVLFDWDEREDSNRVSLIYVGTERSERIRATKHLEWILERFDSRWEGSNDSDSLDRVNVFVRNSIEFLNNPLDKDSRMIGANECALDTSDAGDILNI